MRPHSATGHASCGHATPLRPCYTLAAMLHPCGHATPLRLPHATLECAVWDAPRRRLWHDIADVAGGADRGRCDGCRHCRRLSRWAHSCALLVGLGVLVWLMPRCSGSWQKSTAQAALDSVADVACQLCHSRGRDGCHRGYHRRCFTPALPTMPSGQWYCPHCVPSDLPPTQHIPRRQRREGPWPSG